MKSLPCLKDFFMKFGNHPFQPIGIPSQKLYNRDIGIVTLNFDWHNTCTLSKWWRRDYVYSSDEDDILKPDRKTIVLSKQIGKGKGKGKGLKGKGQGK